jgi:hypothetical protein
MTAMTPNITIGGVLLTDAQARAVIGAIIVVDGFAPFDEPLHEVRAIIEAFEKIDRDSDTSQEPPVHPHTGLAKLPHERRGEELR